VNELQLKLVNSFAARALSVKTVTTNTGKKTPGVDKVILKTDEQKISMVMNLKSAIPGKYKAKSVKKVIIPKANGGQRPLGIPTIYDRATQALYAIALIPLAEYQADPNSYGFRPKRSTRDAVIATKDLISKNI